jgi:hypothetical protein
MLKRVTDLQLWPKLHAVPFEVWFCQQLQSRHVDFVFSECGNEVGEAESAEELLDFVGC